MKDRHGNAIDMPAVLERHGKWRRGEDGGVRADLSGAILSAANLSGANLIGANLRGADLSGANLIGANLIGADLSGANLDSTDLSDAHSILTAGPCDGWMMYAVQHADGIRIHAGCRWYTVAEAVAHWHGRERKEHDAKMLAGVDALLSLARAHGWERCEPLFEQAAREGLGK